MKQIGKGTFTTCYRKNSNQVLLKSTDPAKECMAHGWFPDSHNFPKIAFHGYSMNEYVMKYYPSKPLKQNLKPSEYKFYRELRKVFSRLINIPCYSPQTIKDMVTKYVSKPHKRRILFEAIDALKTYGDDICFEISPRNVRVSDSGNLVLLDVFFFRYKLRGE